MFDLANTDDSNLKSKAAHTVFPGAGEAKDLSRPTLCLCVVYRALCLATACTSEPDKRQEYSTRVLGSGSGSEGKLAYPASSNLAKAAFPVSLLVISAW